MWAKACPFGIWGSRSHSLPGGLVFFVYALGKGHLNDFRTWCNLRLAKSFHLQQFPPSVLSCGSLPDIEISSLFFESHLLRLALDGFSGWLGKLPFLHLKKSVVTYYLCVCTAVCV